MDASTVRTALGTLQHNPDSEDAWNSLTDGLSPDDGDLDASAALELLQAARERHSARGESFAVARLLEASVVLAAGSADEVALLRELATLQLEELFDGTAAIATLSRAAEVAQGDADVVSSLEELQAKSGKWKEQSETYNSEADTATDDAYKSAMLMRAAEAEVCFADEPRFASLVEDLEMSLRLDASNSPAARLLEVIYRRLGDNAGLVRVLDRSSDRAPDLQARIAAGIRLGRLCQHVLDDEEAAAAAFDRVLDSDPNQSDAIEYVTDFYSSRERWDALVRVYERPLAVESADAEHLGEMLQVAMLHWKKREQLADAAPWFERIRKLDPAHDGMLAFYREYKASLDDDAGLAEILEDARRSLAADDSRGAELEQELSSHAASQADAQKSIEEYKSTLRDNPDDAEAREALKVLYKQTQGHNALIEILRQQLERTPEEEYETRLAVMREIAGVYREYMKSDTALVGVLNQIVQLDGKLDEHDVDEVRELVSLYDKLGRPRDLLASQKLLAEIVPDLEEKKVLYRQVGRAWLEQFSNVQHAMEAFAALHEIAKDDEEAIERLEDLYRKRRAWKELFDLYQEQLEGKTQEGRVPLLREMAQLAAERLNRVDDAIDYYKEILDIDPGRTEVLDRLERHAERSKNWEALAEVLERRLAIMPEDETRLPVLQKLGGVYADHLEQPEEAIGTWRRVVEVQPGHPRAMRVLRDTYIKGARFDDLEDLYTSQNDIEGLAEVLSTAADRSKESEIKLDLSYRAARVYEEQLGQSARAMRSYERILSIDPTDVRAVDRLLPLYEADEKWARIPALLEVKVERAETPEEKVAVLEQLVEVASQRLADRRGAVQHARRAYEVAPQNPATIELLDSASRASGNWDEMVLALETRLETLGAASGVADAASSSGTTAEEGASEAATTDEPPAAEQKSGGRRRRRGRKNRKAAAEEPAASADAASADAAPADAASADNAAPATEEDVEVVRERRAVALRFARILGEELGRVDDAVERLKALATEAPDDEGALETLDALLRRESRPDDLRWLYEHRQAHAEGPESQGEILCEWATYEEGEAADAAAALGLYQRALEAHPESIRALESVARLGLAADAAAIAAAALEKHRDLLSGFERAEKDAALASLYAEKLERPQDALAAAERALTEGIEPGRVIPVLQQLVEIAEVRGDAARILSEQYEAGGDSRKEADALRALISETEEASEQIELIERLASVYQEKLAEPGGALAVILEGVAKHSAELPLWDRASELAGASGRTTELADSYKAALRGELPDDLLLELSRRAADLHENVLVDPAGAGPYYEKILTVEPDDEQAFQRLKEILTAGERWRELEELYEREISRLSDESRQIEMLAEMGLLAEDIMGDAERAVTYHERILSLDSEYAPSLDGLDRLYVRLEKKELLLDLLDKRSELAVGEEQQTFLVRAGQLAMALHQPERSIAAIERVLLDEPGHYEARDVAEQLLPIGAVRLRTAKVLEQVYESRDEIRELVRVLGVRIEMLRPTEGEELEEATVREREDERRDLLRRAATLRDDRLHDDEGSFDVFAELVPLDPIDAELRDRLTDSGRRLGRNEKVVEVLLSTSNVADGSALAAEILLQAADIQSDLLEDLVGAEKTLGLVVELREDEPEAGLTALKSLEHLLVREDRGKELVANLELQIELEEDYERKAELLARVAQLSAEVLGDKGAAIAAWEKRLEDNADDTEALSNLSDLYEQVEKFEELGRVLEQLRDSAADEQERLAVIRRLADVQESHLKDVQQAIDSYQTLLDEGGADAEVLKALARLFGSAERWDELADIHERQVDFLEEEADQLAALADLGHVRSAKLGDVSGALEAYRRALSVDPAHAASLEALLELLGHEETSARLEAAEILHPIYEAEGNHERLLTVLEVEAEASDDPGSKAARLEAAVRIAEEELSDPARAMGFATRGARAGAMQGDIAVWMDILDRLAPLANARAAQVEILEAVAPELFDAEQQLQVQKRVAELKRSELSDAEGAIAGYQKCLEITPEDRESMVALEELFEAAADWTQLLGVLESRDEFAEDDEERKALAYRRAELLALKLEDASRAVETYESILDMALEERAISALEKLYTDAERWDDLVALIERRLDSADNPADLRVQLAGVVAERLEDVERGLDELEQALAEDTQHEGAVALLERLGESVESPRLKGRVASLLEPVYMVRADYDSVLKALTLRLAGSEEPDERRELVTRIAQIHEEQREDYGAALEITARLLEDDLQDEATLEEMERLARVASTEVRLAELYEARVLEIDTDDEGTVRLCKRAGEIFADAEQDERARVLLERALAFEPESVPLFDQVDSLLQRVGTPADRVQLYRIGLDHRYEPEEQVKLLHVIAELEEKHLESTEAAIDAHQRVLEVEETNVVSLDALTHLYAGEQSWEQLAELYQRRSEQVEAVEGAHYRLALAALYANRLSQPEAALDQLEEIVRDLPDHKDAIERIEAFREDESLKERAVEILRPLYEQQDDWRRLVMLNEDRFSLAQDPHEQMGILRETAELWELRGEDASRARRVLSEALKLVPDDEDCRADIERLIAMTEEWEPLAELYAGILEQHPDLVCRREFVARLAELYDTYLDDPRAALVHFVELHEMDPSEPEPVEKMVRLATLLGDWPVLGTALEARVDSIYDAAEQVGVLLRLGELRHLTLDDEDVALAAYERAFEIDERSGAVIDRLIPIYEKRDEPTRLVELYLARVETDDVDDEQRYALQRRAAEMLEKKLEDSPRAIECLGNALIARPGDASTIEELNRLYRAEEMWPDLLDNLRLEAGTAETLDRRLEVRHEIASILAGKMDSYEEAIEAYGVVLDERPDDTQALDAVFEIAEREEHLRQQAADLIVPALRQTDLRARLVKALELRLSVEQETTERVETLRRMAEVQEDDLKDPKSAFESLLLALAETPEALDLYDTLERLAGAIEGWARFAEVLEERASETYEPQLARDMWVRLASIRETKTSEKEKAVDAYQKATEQVGDQQDLLDALDRLYTELDDTPAVVDLLDRRMALADSDEAQAKILTRQGQLQLDKQNEPAEALSTLRQALERDVQNVEASELLTRLLDLSDQYEDAFEILDGVYRDRTSGDDLAKLHQLRVDRAGSSEERLEMRRSLAEVLENECKDVLSAQRVLQAGLTDDLSDIGLQDEIERLVRETGAWSEAADALLEAVDATKDIDAEAGRELCQRAATWHRDEAQAPESAEKALVRALDFEPESDDLLEQLQALQTQEGREADLLLTVRRRVALAPDPGTQLEFLKQAKALADTTEQKDVAEEVLREVLEIETEDVWALEGLTHLRRAAGDHQETYDLLKQRAELESDADTIRVLRVDAAEIARDELGKLDEATVIFEELFEQDPADARCAEALQRAYEKGKRFDDLSALLEKLIEAEQDVARKANLRVDLARLRRDHFDDVDQAVDLLERVFADDPDHPDASLVLADVYESSGRNEDLADLLERQSKGAAARGDSEVHLTFLKRLAELYENTLKDLDKAVASWLAIREHEDDEVALEALLRLQLGRDDKLQAAAVLEEICARLDGAAAIERRIELVALYKDLEDTEAVVRTLEATQALDPESAELRQRLRGEYESAGAWQQVADMVLADAEAAGEAKTKIDLYREAATIHLEKREDAQSGADLLAKASELAPDDREILLELCDAYSASGRADESITVLEKIVESYGGKRSKELGEIHRRLATAYLSKGENEKALSELDQAFRIEPGNINILKQLGDVAFETGDMKKAQQMFRALLLQRLDDKAPITKAQVFCKLAQIHQQLGETPKAKQFFERALQADKTLEEAKAGLESL